MSGSLRGSGLKDGASRAQPRPKVISPAPSWFGLNCQFAKGRGGGRDYSDCVRAESNATMQSVPLIHRSTLPIAVLLVLVSVNVASSEA